MKNKAQRIKSISEFFLKYFKLSESDLFKTNKRERIDESGIKLADDFLKRLHEKL